MAVILATILALTALPGATLCVASDGHVAIEAPGSDCLPEADVSRVASDAAPPNASLHSCTDTLLGAPSLTQREGDTSQLVSAVLWHVPALQMLSGDSARLFDAAKYPAAAPPRSLSTVRLL
jgi:hypothetical protein